MALGTHREDPARLRALSARSRARQGWPSAPLIAFFDPQPPQQPPLYPADLAGWVFMDDYAFKIIRASAGWISDLCYPS